MDKEYKYDKSKVAERIKGIREGRNMSQAQFAEWVGYATDTISKLERGLRGISGEMTAAISLQTGISSDYILYGKISNDIQPDTRKQIRELLKESVRLLEQK